MNDIKEHKYHTETNISVGSYDCIKEPHLLFQNIDIKFPIKKKPANNECFDTSKSKEPKQRKKNRKNKKSK
jgi:hypothetical protein